GDRVRTHGLFQGTLGARPRHSGHRDRRGNADSELNDPSRIHTLGGGASPYSADCSPAAWSWTAGAFSRWRWASFAIAANPLSATSRAHSMSSSVCSVDRKARSPVFGMPNKTLFPRQWMNQFHQRRVFALRVSRKFRISSFV